MSLSINRQDPLCSAQMCPPPHLLCFTLPDNLLCPTFKPHRRPVPILCCALKEETRRWITAPAAVHFFKSVRRELKWWDPQMQNVGFAGISWGILNVPLCMWKSAKHVHLFWGIGNWFIKWTTLETTICLSRASVRPTLCVWRTWISRLTHRRGTRWAITPSCSLWETRMSVPVKHLCFCQGPFTRDQTPWLGNIWTPV